MINRLSSLDTYIEAECLGDAERVYDEIAGQLEPPFNMMLPLGQMTIALNLEDPGRAEAAMAGVE